MIRATTPTVVIKLPKMIDMEEATEVYASFETVDGTALFTKDLDSLEVEDNKVYIYLTQAETLSLPLGIVNIMVNWLVDDVRMATDPVEIKVKRNFIEEVL